MATKQQLAQYCADHFPHTTAVSHPMYTIIGLAAASAISFGLGWYIKGRGMTGVQIDLNNVKTDVENIKARVFPTPAPVVIATPVAAVTN